MEIESDRVSFLCRPYNQSSIQDAPSRSGLRTEQNPLPKQLDLRIALSSLLGGVLFALAVWAAMEKVKPPEGFVFQRLPTQTGVYRCCSDNDSNSRTSQSTLNNVRLECLDIGYFQNSRSRDCGVRPLNLEVVEVEQVLIPTFSGPSPIVSKISFRGHSYLHVSDSEIRKRWLLSNTVVLVFAVPFGAMVSALLLLVLAKLLRCGQLSRR